jgi:hypothetical protein
MEIVIHHGRTLSQPLGAFQSGFLADAAIRQMRHFVSSVFIGALRIVHFAASFRIKSNSDPASAGFW